MTLNLRTVKNVCPHDCPDTCGLVVTVDESSGRAVKLRGDKDHPFTKGFLCQKVANYLERVYHPERLLYPLKRTGPKGTGKFQRISWEEAIREIGKRFEGVIAEFGPEAILPYSYAGTMGRVQSQSLDRRFFHRIGASLLDRTICASAGGAGSEVTLGVNSRPAIDPEAAINARTIINWGSNTAVTNIHFWKVEFDARKRGAKIITIDPYNSPTARKSDWWIPIRPGTDAALALGLMHIIFREGWQDEDYLNRYTIGAAELKERVLKEYSPHRVAKITGLDEGTIEQLAKEYGQSQALRGGPALIRLNYGLQRHGGGGMAVRTLCCLPAITGDWRHPGGGALLSTSKLFPYVTAPLERPDLIPPGTRTINMTRLAEALNNEYPGPPVKALCVYNSNPASIAPDQNRVLKGLQREDLFTVVLEHFLTDTAKYADIVLPATGQLEHWDIHSAYGHIYAQANPPAIAAPGETKPNTEIFRLLAKEMNLEPELFAETDKELAELALDGGRHFALKGNVEAIMKAEGAVRLNYPPDYAPFAQGNFGTPEGKCYLFSPLEAAAGRDGLPFYQPPHEDPQTQPALAEKYPLQMICTKDPAFLNSSFANVPSLRANAGEPNIELNSEDATTRGITDGQMVTIKNDRGSFVAKAYVRDHVPGGTVAAFALRWNADMATNVNVNATTSTKLTDFGAGATFFDCLVEVS